MQSVDQLNQIIHLLTTQLIIDSHRFGQLKQEEMKQDVDRTLAIVKSGAV